MASADKNGNVLSIGDEVILKCRVTWVFPNGDVNLETCEPVPDIIAAPEVPIEGVSPEPTGPKAYYSAKSKQVEKVAPESPVVPVVEG